MKSEKVNITDEVLQIYRFDFKIMSCLKIFNEHILIIRTRHIKGKDTN